jgi:hypothetical protein
MIQDLLKCYKLFMKMKLHMQQQVLSGLHISVNIHNGNW